MKSDNEDKDKDKYRAYAYLLIAAGIYALGYYKGRSQALSRMIILCTK